MILVEHDDEMQQEVQREIRVEKLFKNAFIANTVQYNTVEINNKNGIAIITGIDFTKRKLLFEFDSKIDVSSDEQLIKFHFSLKGTYAFQPLGHIKYLVQIPDNHCNMMYSPKTKGGGIIFKDCAKVFEIYVKPRVLQDLLGDTFDTAFSGLQNAITNSNSFVLWDKSKFIPPHIRSYINDILQCPYKGAIRKRYLESKLTVLLIDFLLGRQTAKINKNHIKLLNSDYLALVKVEEHIRKNLKEPLKILDLADVAGFNATKLKRDFKKLYGLTVFKYITALRMEAAKSMISQNGTTIAEASYKVGYANPQHFTAAFKRTMGYLPSELKPETT